MFNRLYPVKNRALLAQVFLVSSASIMTGCASTKKHAETSVDPVSAKHKPG